MTVDKGNYDDRSETLTVKFFIISLNKKIFSSFTIKIIDTLSVWFFYNSRFSMRNKSDIFFLLKYP